MKALLIIILLVITSCKSSQHCEAYSEVKDISTEDIQAQKKYVTSETLK